MINMPHTHPKTHKSGISRGVVFDTTKRTHYVALSTPDRDGDFTAIDPEGDIVYINLDVVEFVRITEIPYIIA